jgi:hypothetical protein
MNIEERKQLRLNVIKKSFEYYFLTHKVQRINRFGELVSRNYTMTDLAKDMGIHYISIKRWMERGMIRKSNLQQLIKMGILPEGFK